MDFEKLNKYLLICAGAVFAFILITVTSFKLINREKMGEYRKQDPSPEKVVNLSARKNDKVSAYTALGEIRAVTKDAAESGKKGIVCVRPWFSYPEGDSVMFEELSDKNRKIKLIFSEYFGQFTTKELYSRGEKKVKEDLLELINEELVLGKITGVYFDAYIFLE